MSTGGSVAEPLAEPQHRAHRAEACVSFRHSVVVGSDDEPHDWLLVIGVAHLDARRSCAANHLYACHHPILLCLRHVTHGLMRPSVSIAPRQRGQMLSSGTSSDGICRPSSIGLPQRARRWPSGVMTTCQAFPSKYGTMWIGSSSSIESSRTGASC